MSTRIHIPAPARVPSETEIWQWYLNVEQELSALDLTSAESACVRDYYVEAGLFRSERRRFFRRHYARTVAEAIRFLFQGRERPVILDLGCGMGTQSLLFALLGARVVGLDLDQTALAVLNKRQALYERLSGRALSVECKATDTLQFDYSTAGPIDGVFSMFAFNMMQPSGALVDRMLAGCAADVRICILDGNNRSWLARFVPSRRRSVWSPAEFAGELRSRRFSIANHRGGVSLPPALWNLAPRPLLDAIDGAMNRTWFLPVSHLIMATRHGQ